MTICRVSSDAACAMLEDGAVVLHLGTKRYYSLNETGAFIWSMLEKGSHGEDIVASLVVNYAVDETSAAVAVDRLLRELLADRLVERAV
ncbi:MAG: PqqD family protein [Gemmatimonadaceae bacterium]